MENDAVVYDEPHDCPYLEGEIARTPLRIPAPGFSPDRFDQCLAEGDRRTGRFLYRNACRACTACESIRIPVARFQPSRNKRRVFNRGDRRLVTKFGPAAADSHRVGLFNRHRNERGMNNEGGDASLSSYRSFLVDSCCETMEMSYWLDERLVGIAICDLGKKSMSAVYSYFNPDVGQFSLGTYSVLKQIEFCQTNGYELLYLGFYVAESPHMRYKAQYKPHERLIAGEWVEFL